MRDDRSAIDAGPRGRKLVVVGGSSVHTPALLVALSRASCTSFRELCLVGRSAQKVEQVGTGCRELARGLGLDLTVSWETDLSVAARDATHVVNVLRIGGVAAEIQDRRNLAVSGIVGHASSYLEAIRHLAPTLAAANVVQTVAPRAIFINFTNPVSILCEAIAQSTSVRCIGICHHAFSLQSEFAALLHVERERVRVAYRGLNHLGWVTDVLVDGTSRFAWLVDHLVSRRRKDFDYNLIRRLDAIPIKHAAALYHRRQVLYVRQDGIRGSVANMLRSIGTPHLADVLDGNSAPDQRDTVWYERCIVPFLQTLTGTLPREHIVTWQHDGQIADVPGRTAEASGLVHTNAEVSALPLDGRSLPPAAETWLRQVRTSEHLLIKAAAQQSSQLLVEALEAHPNVASIQHARRFVQRLIRGGLWSV